MTQFISCVERVVRMTKHQIQTLVVSALLLLAGCYVVFIFIPNVVSTQIIGYSGEYDGTNLIVSDVFNGSPADLNGIREGDVILRQSGHSIADWHQWYTTDFHNYLEARISLLGTPGTYSILRTPDQLDVVFSPRRLSIRDITTQFGVRIFLILFIISLAIFVVTSRTRELSAFLTCLCFCFTIFWLASDQPHWPQFSSPLIRDTGLEQATFVDLIDVFSIQLVMGTLLHIALIFPRRQSVLRTHKWLPLCVYAAALIMPFAIIVFGEGGLGDRVLNTYKPRLYLNSVLIILITALLVENYRRTDLPALKERTRWIVVAMGIVAVSHLVLWNIPTLVMGNPLLTNYNWLLLTVVLLPIALTISITNHELFGVRGIIRGRIKLLETRLDREKQLVKSRDVYIRGMQGEIRQLNEALDQYSMMEEYEPEVLDQELEKLERQYPELKDIRQQRLIGVSPLWKNVFEQTVIAAHGLGPVLVVGESGTGKTDVAWAVHRFGERRGQVYKEISCAQFEHADPAFALGRLFGIGSGHGLPNVAREGKPGLLEECDGGTLLLDDFDRLPLNVQDLFLYPLEGKPFDPGIGSGPSRSVSIKFIFATNRDPEQLVEAGTLRDDVLARMVARIDIPALRERKEDIPILVEHLTRRVAGELGHDISVVSPKALNLLSRYPYDRGNVRELKAELQKAVSKAALEEDNVLRAGYLSQSIRLDLNVDAAVSRPHTGRPDRNKSFANSVELEALRRHKFQVVAAEEELGYSHKSKTLSNHLRGMCIQALADCDWDTDSAARSLAGSNNAKEASKLKAKMERFLVRVDEHVRNNTQDKLFNNLPAAYHDALTKAIARLGS